MATGKRYWQVECLLLNVYASIGERRLFWLAWLRKHVSPAIDKRLLCQHLNDAELWLQRWRLYLKLI